MWTEPKNRNPKNRPIWSIRVRIWFSGLKCPALADAVLVFAQLGVGIVTRAPGRTRDSILSGGCVAVEGSRTRGGQRLGWPGACLQHAAMLADGREPVDKILASGIAPE